MHYVKNTYDFHILEPAAVSLGKFDGLHTGHKLLIEKIEEGRRQGMVSAAITFDIPPKSIHSDSYKVLSTNAEKEIIFDAAGIDYLIELPFTERFKHLSPHEFLKMLTDRINIRMIVTGTDFHFGRQRSGDYHTLQQYAEEFHYQAEVVEKLKYNGEDVSSTRIRGLISEGKMEEANRLLGYEYFVLGKVLHGNKIGRTIGIPTANLLPEDEKLLPPLGVYASHIRIGSRTFLGITNIGKKPTVGDHYPVGLETFIFDFDGDLYDSIIQVSLLKYLRPEHKFASLDQLKEQMNRDIAECKKIFG